jgi:hypothetical protein
MKEIEQLPSAGKEEETLQLNITIPWGEIPALQNSTRANIKTRDVWAAQELMTTGMELRLLNVSSHQTNYWYCRHLRYNDFKYVKNIL